MATKSRPAASRIYIKSTNTIAVGLNIVPILLILDIKTTLYSCLGLHPGGVQPGEFSKCPLPFTARGSTKIIREPYYVEHIEH